MKRNRSDSSTAAVEAMQAAGSEIPAPESLTPEDVPYWRSITRARAREDWTNIDLMHAASLARLMRYIDESHVEIAEQGMTVVNERGTQIDNPAFSRLEKLSRLALSMSTKLHVHAEATVGKSEDSAKRATKQREAEHTIQQADDDLIAKPMH